MGPDNLLKKPCPNCGVSRLWPGPLIGAPGKVYCMECGKTFKVKK